MSERGSQRARRRTRDLALVDAEAKQIKQRVEEAFEDLKVEGVEVDEVSESGDHSRRDPEAHLLLHRARPQRSEDREENSLADAVPEVGSEGGSVGLEGVEERVEGAGGEGRIVSRHQSIGRRMARAWEESNLHPPNLEILARHENIVVAEQYREPEFDHRIVDRRRLPLRQRPRCALF
jgi:hypothetical protein